MMLPALSGRQPQMAAGLPRDFVAQAPQPFGKIRSRNVSRQFHLTNESGVNWHSARKHFVADKMQTNHLRGVSLIEMAIHSIANLLPKRVQSVRLGKDRLTQGSRRKAAFRRILDQENNFVHALRAKSVFQLRRESLRFGVHWQELSQSVDYRVENRAEGVSEIEGKVARVATSELGSERVSMTWPAVMAATRMMAA